MDRIGALIARVCWAGVAVLAICSPDLRSSIPAIPAVLALLLLSIWLGRWEEECVGLLAALVAVCAAPMTSSLPEAAGSDTVTNIHAGVLLVALGTATAMLRGRPLPESTLSRSGIATALVAGAISFFAYITLRHWYGLDDTTIRRTILHCLLTAAAFASAPALLPCPPSHVPGQVRSCP